MEPIISQAYLKRLFNYNPDTGSFTWKVSRAWFLKVGDIAGRIDGQGYCQIKIDGRLYAAHRLVWVYLYDKWPEDQIDHIDGDRSNNKRSNLRACTGSENVQNRCANKTNVSGLVGVSWHKATQKWYSQIRYQNKNKYLGVYDTPEEAHEAYLKAKAGLHKFQPVPRLSQAA